MTDPKEKKDPIKTRTPGRLSRGGMFDRVKLPTERHPIEEIIYGGAPPPASLDADTAGATDTAGNTESTGTTTQTGTTGQTTTTAPSGTTDETGSTGISGTTGKIGITRRIGSTGKVGSTKRANTGDSSAVSPERDFQKVPNSITRAAMAERLFKGKSKHVWDYLWSQSRGAVVPTRTVRRSRPQIKAGAGFGSMTTVDSAIEHLQAVGLITVKTIVGENGGNEYEVFTPEEVAAGIFGLPTQTGTTAETGSTETTRNSVVPVVPESGSTGSTSTSIDSEGSGRPKTSFKTIETKTDDDEAFAGLIALLKQATSEVTGKDASPAEAERWKEVGELLVAELKQAAARTTVSSAPAFLAEHLRRRLSRQPAPQHSPKTAAPAPPAPAPEPPTDDELVEMFTGFLHQGMTPADLDGQLSASIDPERWPHIRAAALERYERERGQMRPPE